MSAEFGDPSFEELGEAPFTPPDPTGYDDSYEGHHFRAPKLVVADLTQAAKIEARAASERAMTETPEKMKLKGYKSYDKGKSFIDFAHEVTDTTVENSKEIGKGIATIARRIWKQNLWREYYRQKEIAKVRQYIAQEGDIWAHRADMSQEDREDAKEAIIDQFLSEYDEVIHEDAGEERWEVGTGRHDREDADKEKQIDREQTIKARLIDLIRDYVLDRIDDETFEEAKQKYYNQIFGYNTRDKNAVYADNILEIAHHIRANLHHYEGLENLDKAIEITAGVALPGVREGNSYNAVDKLTDTIVEKSRIFEHAPLPKGLEFLRSLPLSNFVNETTISASLAIAHTTILKQSTGLLKAITSPLGGGLIIGGAVAAATEGRRLSDEREMVSRDMAEGLDSKDDPKSQRRRTEMEKFVYEMRSTTDILNDIQESLYDDTGELRQFESQEEIIAAVAPIIEIDARNLLADFDGIKTIRYSSGAAVSERLQLDIARAEAVQQLMDYGYITNPAYYRDQAEKRANEIVKGDVKEKNKAFAHMKRKACGKRFLQAAVWGAIIGQTSKEMIEHFFGSTPTVSPPLEPTGEHTVEVLGHDIDLPNGVGVIEDKEHGTFDLVKNNEVIANDLEMTNDGTLTEESKEQLVKIGGDYDHIKIESTVTLPATPEEIAQNARPDHPELPAGETTLSHAEDTAVTPPESDRSGERYVDSHTNQPIDVQRIGWVNSPNAQALHWGNEGTGYDGKNYILDVSQMKSFTDNNGHAIDPKELIKEGKLQLLLTGASGSKEHVLPISIRPDGKAIIPTDSLGAQLFRTDNHGHAVFQGKTLEVAHVLGKNDAGNESVRILATHVGSGKVPLPEITDTVDSTTETDSPPLANEAPTPTPTNQETDSASEDLTKTETRVTYTPRITLPGPALSPQETSSGGFALPAVLSRTPIEAKSELLGDALETLTDPHQKKPASKGPRDATRSPWYSGYSNPPGGAPYSSEKLEDWEDPEEADAPAVGDPDESREEKPFDPNEVPIPPLPRHEDFDQTAAPPRPDQPDGGAPANIEEYADDSGNLYTNPSRKAYYYLKQRELVDLESDLSTHHPDIWFSPTLNPDRLIANTLAKHGLSQRGIIYALLDQKNNLEKAQEWGAEAIHPRNRELSDTELEGGFSSGRGIQKGKGYAALDKWASQIAKEIEALDNADLMLPPFMRNR